MNQKLYKRLEIAGGAVVFALSTFLHFFYSLSGGSMVGALFGAVNESVWEHLKIFGISYLVWAAVELLWARPSLRKFIFAKALGLFSLWISIAVFYYIYTFFTGGPVLAVDLASGIVFSVVAHYISLGLTLSDKNCGQYFYTGIMLLVLALVMMLCFSFFPPQSDLFRDPRTGFYGVPPKALDAGAVILDSTQGE